MSRWQECFILLALASLALLSILYKTNLLAGHSDINFKDHSHITKLSLSCVHLPHFKVGDAGLVQRSPLKPNGRDSRYKDPPLPVRSTHSKSDSNSIWCFLGFQRAAGRAKTLFDSLFLLRQKPHFTSGERLQGKLLILYSVKLLMLL